MPGSPKESIAIRSHNKVITSITTDQLIDIFDIYDDERLIERTFVHEALERRSITISMIKKEADTLNIPWQLFLLEPNKLTATINLIRKKRNAKFNKRLIASRDDNGRGISLRIADRVIALQEYAKTSVITPNRFNNSLKSLNQTECVARLLSFFDIVHDRLHGRTKLSTLEYLISRLEAKNIRVARGVLANKMMPGASDIRATYKKSSGFIVYDNNVPYVFLPSEISEREESTGRQILTLISLVVLLGKGEHNIFVNGQLEVQYNANQHLKNAFEVAGRILLPETVSDALRGKNIDATTRDELASEYMLTPSAIVITLRNRGVIEADETAEALLESIPAHSGSTSIARTPKMETSVRKFCGNTTATEMMRDISNGRLGSISAQYLLFGHVDKKHFAKLKAGMGL